MGLALSDGESVEGLCVCGGVFGGEGWGVRKGGGKGDGWDRGGKEGGMYVVVEF